MAPARTHISLAKGGVLCTFAATARTLAARRQRCVPLGPSDPRLPERDFVSCDVRLERAESADVR